MADAPAFVPVATRVPSWWRIIQRDSAAGLLAAFFVLGVALVAVYVVAALRPTPPPVASKLAESISLIRAPAPAIDALAWLGTGITLALLLPLRLWRIRRLFRRGVEVTGRIETQHRGFRSTTVAYCYDYDGHRYLDTFPLTLATSLAHGAAVAVVVDPDRPSRSILKHAFILEPVDPVPLARLHRG